MTRPRNPEDDSPLRPISSVAPQPVRREPHIEWAVAYDDGALATYDDEKAARAALAYARDKQQHGDKRIRTLFAGAHLVVRTVTAWTVHPQGPR